MTTMTPPKPVADLPHASFSSLDDYMRFHIPEIAGRLRAGLSPLFDLGRDGMPPSVAALFSEPMRPYPAQAVNVAGMSAAMRRASIIFCNGEAGCGKSAIGCWALRELALQLGRPVRAVLTCPNQLPNKWRRHAEQIIPGCRVVIVRSFAQLFELDRAGPPDRNELWIIPRDSGKLGYAFRLAVIRRMVPRPFQVQDDRTNRMVRELIPVEEFSCPCCGHRVERRNPKTGETESVEASYFGGGLTVTGRKSRLSKRWCLECGEPLWQANNGTGGSRIVDGRWQAQHQDPNLPAPGTAPRKCSPADYIGRRKLRFDAYIPDECFPGDTPISTLTGTERIDAIRVGQMVWSRNADGKRVLRRVSRVIAKPRSRDLVTVRHEHGSFDCTPNHKVWTASGYDGAASLSPGDRLCVLSDTVLSEGCPDPVLLEVMRATASLATRDPERGSDSPFALDTIGQSEPSRWTRQSTRPDGDGYSAGPAFAGLSCVPSTVHAQGRDHQDLRSPVRGNPDLAATRDQTGHCPEVGGSPENRHAASGRGRALAANEQGSCLSREVGRGEARSGVRGAPGWQRDTDPATGEARGAPGVAVRVSHRDGQPFLDCRGRGSCGADLSGGGRGRRGLASQPEAEDPGPAEGRDAARLGLDPAAVLERGGGRRPGGSRGGLSEGRVVSVGPSDRRDEWVYDLEVEDTHCYFAAGVLVSNCHELANLSLQGQMFATIARRSAKVLPLTGTLVGGYARNLLHILWRTMPQRLVRDGLLHCEEGFEEFERRYGVLREETVYVKASSTQSDLDLQLGRGKVKSRTLRSLPGISPLLFTRFLIGHTVFIRLAQMHAELPPFREFVHQIPLLRSQREALIRMQEDYRRHRARMEKLQEPVRCWSRVRHCFLRWPDRPWPAQVVTDFSIKEGPLHVFDVPALSREVEYPKEIRLRRLVQREKREGRRCWIFTELTGPVWNVTDRLVEYLGRHGISAAVLRSQAHGGPRPQDREEWIDRQNADVVISNPNLVKTGLDLYDFPTIIFAFTGDSVYTLRQASRRAWRLGQKHDCRVHYLCYSGAECREAANHVPSGSGSTEGPVGQPSLSFDPEAPRRPREPEPYQCVQAAALSLMAQKMDAALTLEGDFSAEGLAAMSPGDDIQSKLARVIAGSLIVEDAGVVFARYRERLERLMPSIVAGRPADAVPPPAPRLPDPIPEPAARPARRRAPAPRPAGPTGPSLGSLLALLDRTSPDIAAKLRSDLQKAKGQ